MNKLLKYIIIVNLVFIILFVLSVLNAFLYKNYKANYYTQSEIDEFHSKGELVPVPKGPYLSIRLGLSGLLIYILPIFIILMSAIYQFKNLDFRGYLKSLLIPLSYIVIAYISMGLAGEGMTLLYFLVQFAVAFVAVLIINLIVTLVKRRKNPA